MSYKCKVKLRPRLISGKWRIQGTAPVIGLVRKQFKTEAEAMDEYERIIQQVDNATAGAEIREVLLSKDQEKEAVGAFHFLESQSHLAGLSLTDLVHWASRNYSADLIELTVGEAKEKYIQELKARKRSLPHINKNEQRLAKLLRFFPTKKVNDFTPEEIKSYISTDKDAYGPFAGLDRSPTTLTGELIYLRSFFTWCVNHKYCKSSPCDATVYSPGRNRAEIKALTLDEVKAVFKIVPDFFPEITVPYFALSIFCGLRPEELLNMDPDKADLQWSDFVWHNSGEASLSITYGVGKASTRRVISVPPNCIEWIRPWAEKAEFTGPVINTTFGTLRGMAEYVRAKVGYRVGAKNIKQYDADLASYSNDDDRKKWIPDGLRHTGISYQLVASGSDYLHTAEWSGNSESMIKEHYKALIKGSTEMTPKEEVRAFYSIIPNDDVTNRQRPTRLL